MPSARTCRSPEPLFSIRAEKGSRDKPLSRLKAGGLPVAIVVSQTAASFSRPAQSNLFIRFAAFLVGRQAQSTAYTQCPGGLSQALLVNSLATRTSWRRQHDAAKEGARAFDPLSSGQAAIRRSGSDCCRGTRGSGRAIPRQGRRDLLTSVYASSTVDDPSSQPTDSLARPGDLHVY